MPNAPYLRSQFAMHNSTSPVTAALGQLRIWLGSLPLWLLMACSHTPSDPTEQPNRGRYQLEHDSAPVRVPTSDEMRDPMVKDEPIYPPANKPYVVMGKSYTPQTDSHGFVQYGVASWYGRKFHGHQTSNGEIFNMFAMTAAHTTLPLPSYVKVTNVENGKTAVVRVNDRGPFHPDRIIDLSYAAAYKLGVVQNGTARVKLEALHVDDRPLAGREIQVVALSNHANAIKLRDQLKQQFGVPSFILAGSGTFRVRIGPIPSEQQAQQILASLKRQGFEKPLLLYSGQ